MTLTDTDLDLLRTRGDRLLDQWMASLSLENARTTLRDSANGGGPLTAKTATIAAAVPADYWDEPLVFDQDRLQVGAELFRRQGSIVAGALLFSALPSTYAAVDGVQILGTTGKLNGSTSRRIAEVAQFLVDITTGLTNGRPMLTPGHPGYQAARSVRLLHAVIRRLDPDVGRTEPRRTVWINQEELLATLLSFTVNVFETLARLDVTWTEDEQEAYLYLWDCVGQLMGIGTDDAVGELARIRPLRPRSVDEATDLLDRIRRRQWPDLDDTTLDTASVATVLPGLWSGGDGSLPLVATGRRLFRSLLDEVEAANHRTSDSGKAIEVFRYLLDPRAACLLGVGGAGTVDALAATLWLRRIRTGPATSFRPPNPAQALMMRRRVDRMTAKAFVHFVRAAPEARPFRLNGLEDLLPERRLRT